MAKTGILFIGGCGFIGSNLVNRFLLGNYDIHIFETPQAPIDRIKDNIDKVNLYRGQLEDTLFIKSIIEQNNIKKIVYHGSCLLPNSSIEDYQEEISNVIKPTIDIIHLCAEQNIEFVYFSSGGTIYGNNGDIFHSETDLVAPISYYGLSKCHLENVIKIENRRNNLSYLILRPSNPYGHGQRINAKQGLIAVSIGKVLRNEPIEIFGDGTNVRDYIYIDDLCESVFQLIDKNIVNETFNIGSGRGYTNTEVVSIINKISGDKCQIINRQVRSGDVKSVILNQEKLKRYIQVKNRDLEEGVNKFYKEELQAYNINNQIGR